MSETLLSSTNRHNSWTSGCGGPWSVVEMPFQDSRTYSEWHSNNVGVRPDGYCWDTLAQCFLYGDSNRRKEAPMAQGLLWYFPDALAAVANVSKIGNDQHNPGQAMFHNRGKSGDHADCILRHLAHAGEFDKDGVRETAKVAWRALAMLQEELEREYQLPLPKNAHY